MNFLAHLYLSGNVPELQIGNLMGDFVKGRVGVEFPDEIRKGIVLHRRIDIFAQHHPLFHRSRLRLAPGYRHYRGVMVDLFYDHFLASDWDLWSDKPLDTWLHEIRATVEAHSFLLPERLRNVVPVIFDELIPSYGEIEGIAHALARMSRRIERPNPLYGGESELVIHYDGLREDFLGFLPDARRHAKDFCSSYQPVMT